MGAMHMGRLQPMGLLMGLAVLSGCVEAYQSVRPEPRLYAAARPAPGYYCYDCHGYQYLDPYYDWCPPNSYRIRWDQSPQLMRVYRERYVALKEQNRTLGRYRYAERYRSTPGYRETRHYRDDPSQGAPEPDRRIQDSRREQGAPGRGKSERAPHDAGDSRPEHSRDQRTQGTES